MNKNTKLFSIPKLFSKQAVAIYYLFMIASNLSADAMHNLQPYSSLIRPPYTRHLDYHLNLFTEGGIGSKSFNDQNAVAGPLQIWQPDQNSLAMLDGFAPESKIGLLKEKIERANGRANDDGIRGHLAFCGDLNA